MNISEIDDALSDALNSLAAAQATLRKSLPGRAIDVLRKSDLTDDALPRASLTADAATKAIAMLDDATRRLERLEAGRDCDAQTARKSYTIGGAR
jgi:hypothetical protein